jgi:Na+-driven multidrug efflux pump
MKKRLAFLTEPGAMLGPQQLWRLLWPLLVEQLLSVLIGMIDVLMVSYVGESAVSGVSLVDSINHLILMVLFAMTSGGTVVCAQYLGKKDAASAAKSSAQLVMITVLVMTGVSASFFAGGKALLRLIFGQVEVPVVSAELI